MLNKRAALIIIFNHRYDRNLLLLRQIYEKRFRIIRFLVPFYDGSDDDVIPVYESSFHFQGYYIQAYKELMSLDCDFFFFISDDALIHPMINDENIMKWLEMDEKDIFIDSFAELNSPGMFEFFPCIDIAHSFGRCGVEYKAQLPSFDEAVGLYEKFMDCKYKPQYSAEFFGEAMEFCEDLVKKFIKSNGGDKTIHYPLLFGYADYFLVRKNKFYALARMCGIFAAMDLFVEIAFPTAVMLTFERNEVVTRQDIGTYKIRLNTEDYKEKYNFSLNKLFDRWETEMLFIHPIKLSEWKYNTEIVENTENNLRKKLMELPLGKSGRVGIYGTGDTTEALLEGYRELVGEIKATLFFIDSYKKSYEHTFRGGGYIYNVADLYELQLDDIIVSSLIYEEEMVKKIKELYGNKYPIYRFYEKGKKENIIRDVTNVHVQKAGLPKLKVKMIGFLFRAAGKNCLAYELLCKHYNVEFSEQPELLIYSHPSVNTVKEHIFMRTLGLRASWIDTYSQKEHLKYENCIKLLWKIGMNENGYDDYDYDYDDRDYDYAVGFPYLQGENFEYFNISIPKQCYEIKQHYDDSSLNRDFCSYLYLNENWGEGAKLRKVFINELSDNYKKVECVRDDGEFMATYNKYKFKFMIAFENHSIPGYATRTLWNAYSCGAIPIYWGAPDICSRIGVNPDSLINCTRFGTDVDAMIKEVERIDRDNELYMYMLNQAPFAQGVNYSTNKLEQLLCNIAERARKHS